MREGNEGMDEKDNEKSTSTQEREIKVRPEGEENEPHAQREEKGWLKEGNGHVKMEQEGR